MRQRHNFHLKIGRNVKQYQVYRALIRLNIQYGDTLTPTIDSNNQQYYLIFAGLLCWGVIKGVEILPPARPQRANQNNKLFSI